MYMYMYLITIADKIALLTGGVVPLPVGATPQFNPGLVGRGRKMSQTKLFMAQKNIWCVFTRYLLKRFFKIVCVHCANYVYYL